MSSTAAPASQSFDADWYLKAYPDVAAYIAAGGLGNGHPLDALSHYLEFGAAEGRKPNANAPDRAPTQAQIDRSNIASGQGTPRLDPTDPSSWSAWADKAHAQTAGINRLPYMLGDTSQIGTDPYSTLAAFYPQGPQAKSLEATRAATAAAALGQSPAASSAVSATNGITADQMAQILALSKGAVSNLGMGNAMAGGAGLNGMYG